jgi:hypothetical protein
MTTTIKDVNHDQLRELATGIKSDFVYDALDFIYPLCGLTVQAQIKEALKISPEHGLTHEVCMNEIGEPGSDGWKEYIAKGQKALQLVIDHMPKKELFTGYRYLEYIVSNE